MEQDPTKASLYGVSTHHNHVVVLVKLALQDGRPHGPRDAPKDIAVAVKSDNPGLALNLKEELARIEGLSLN